MANSDKDIIITPNRGSSADDPKVEYRGANSSVGSQTITSRVYPTSNGTLSFEGSAGQLFSITNSLTGTLFSVNDVSGIPSLEVIDTGVVRLAQYSGRVLLGNVTDDGLLALQINGGLRTSMMWVNFSSANYNNYNEGIRLYEAGNGAAVMTFNTPGTTGSSYSSILGYTDRQERRWAGQWQDRLYNGYMEAYGSYRAPIFYDSSSTSYSLDLAVTSGTIMATGASADTLGYNASYGIYIGGINSRYIYSGNSSYNGPIFYNGSSAYTIWHNGNLTNLNQLTNGPGFISSVSFDGLTSKTGGTGTYTTSGDFRAPVFYDSQDTNYFMDPAGTSKLHYIDSINEASFRGVANAINDWDYTGLSANPTNNGTTDGAWYVASSSYDWSRGLLSKRRFRRVDGLTLDLELNVASGSTIMFGFVGGNTSSFSYSQTPSNLLYLTGGSVYVYENSSNSGSTVYSFSYEGNWKRFKVVLKTTGATYYVFDSGRWNIILDTSNNSMDSYEYVRVLFSTYFSTKLTIRNIKVYTNTLAEGFSGQSFLHTINGYGIATTAFQAPRFEDSNNTSWFTDPASTSFLSKLRLNNTSGPSDSTYGTAASVPLHISGADKVNTTILIENNTNTSLEYPHLILRRTVTPSANRFGGFLRFADKNSSGSELSASVYSFNMQTHMDLYVSSNDNVTGGNSRVLINGNLYVASSTDTSYIYFNTSTYSKVVEPAALDINCRSGNYFTKTISADSTFTFSNPTANLLTVTASYSFTLELTHTSGTVTWPASVKWPGNTAPSLTTGKTHLFMFVTDDGGTTFRGAALTNYNN